MVRKTARTVRGDFADAAVRGVIAGVLGGIAMKAATEMQQRALLPEGQKMAPPPERLVEAAADKQGVDLTPRQEQIATMGVHIGYSAVWGAIYDVSQNALELPPVLHDLLLGAVVYTATMGPSGLLPRIRIMPSPLLEPLRQAAVPAGAHVAYGLATAVAFDSLS